MSDVNLFEVALNDEDDDPPGYHALYERIERRLRAIVSLGGGGHGLFSVYGAGYF